MQFLNGSIPILSLYRPSRWPMLSFLYPHFGKPRIIASSDQHHLVFLWPRNVLIFYAWVEFFALHNHMVLASCLSPCCQMVKLVGDPDRNAVFSLWSLIGFRRLQSRVVDYDLLCIDNIMRYMRLISNNRHSVLKNFISRSSLSWLWFALNLSRWKWPFFRCRSLFDLLSA